MKRGIFIILGIMFFASMPSIVQAAITMGGARNIVFTKSVPAANNVYVAGATIIIATTTPQDLTVIGGSVILSAPVRKDALVVGGSIGVRAPIGGNLQVAGIRVSVSAPVSNDLAVMGFSVVDRGGTPGDVLAVGGTVRLLSGARGTVTVYGNDVYLSGTFDKSVSVRAINILTLAPHTIIHGSLRYEASEAANIPSSVQIGGPVTYIGASFLPTSQEASAFALAGMGIFFLVRIIGALIVAGLFVGFFPAFTNKVAKQVTNEPFRHTLLMLLLGFGIIAATPILLFFLAISFVGLGAAFILGAVYVLLLLLAFVYAGIISGAILRKSFSNRDKPVTWKDAVFGMFVLMLISIVPVFGMLTIWVLMCIATGILGSLFYHFAFIHRTSEPL
ncbi:MAG TPA: hypothetical protein ENI56_01760 [Candidatus Kaiserbacteria bacterium]|nr:hypothetical protein [Candidatus Kaiserbacteria bacterium]